MTTEKKSEKAAPAEPATQAEPEYALYVETENYGCVKLTEPPRERPRVKSGPDA